MNEICPLSDVSKNFGITLLSWNCRSLYGKLPEIIHILQESDCEMAIFTESWCTASLTDEMLHIDGYILFRQDRDHHSNKNMVEGYLYM